MESSKRRVGRPKTSPQTGPLVLSERRTRTKIEIEIGAEAAEDLAEYVRWVEVSEAMSTADARATTVEFALREVFKRDRLWKEWRRSAEVAEPPRQPAQTVESTPASSSRPPSAPRTPPAPSPRAAGERSSILAPEKT